MSGLPYIEIIINYRHLPFNLQPVGKLENYGNPQTSPFWIVRGNNAAHRPPILKFKPTILKPDTELHLHQEEDFGLFLLPAKGRVKLVPIERGTVVDYVILRNF